MLRALEQDPHEARLLLLLQGFRSEEASLTVALELLYLEIELCQRDATSLREIGGGETAATLHRCRELQTAVDCLATELVHVRLAVSGAEEELADHLERRPHRLAPRGSGRPLELRA